MSTSKLPESVNVTLIGKGLFAEVIKDFEMKLSWIIQVGSKYNKKCHYKKHRKKEEDMWRGRQRLSDAATSQGKPKVTRNWKRQGKILQRKCGPVDTLI